MRIFIAGTGFSGAMIAKQLVNAGHEVFGLNRKGVLDSVPQVQMLSGNVLDPRSLAPLQALPEMDVMVSALSATGVKDRNLYRELYVEGPVRIARMLPWAGESKCWLLGSTGVYGEERGEWVTEDTEARPLHHGGQVQLEAERALRAEMGHLSVLRLSGLYGPSRTRLIRQALRKRPYFKADLWSNQIHVEDVAGVVGYVIENELMPEVLLVSDDHPVQRQEIFDWIRQETGYVEGVYDEDHPGAGRNRGNKRVSNERLKGLGYRMIHPDYRSGLRHYLPSIP